MLKTTYQEVLFDRLVDHYAKDFVLPKGEYWAVANPWTAFYDPVKRIVIFKLLTVTKDSDEGGPQ